MKYSKQHEKRLFAERFYVLLLYLYPAAHRRKYGPLMLQTFKDYYRETFDEPGQVGAAFWLEVITDGAGSALREQLSSLYEGFMQYIQNRSGIFFGLLLGILAVGNIVWTNVLFPNPATENGYALPYILFLLGIFLFFLLVGFLASCQTNHLLSGARAGALTALIGFGMAMLTFFIIDNIWLGIVSQQADKIFGFQHSGYHTMRDYINASLLTGTLILLPILVVIGAAGGTLGATLRRYLPSSR